MPRPLRWLHQRLFRISTSQVSVETRGFWAGAAGVRERLESIGATVLAGHHAALDAPSIDALVVELERVAPELRGFAYEGAAMGTALLDAAPMARGGEWSALYAQSGARHAYMLHVGAGMAWGRLARRIALPIPGFDPLLSALVADGYGFQAGYFHAARFAQGQAAPARLAGYAARAFDQGLGRSFWFVHGADPDRIAHAIAHFSNARCGDLWSGVGLACVYAGGLGAASIARLRELSQEHEADLAQGAAFAAEARARAGNATPHTRVAAQGLCGCDDVQAAGVARQMREALPPATDGTAYEEWRRRIANRFGQRVVTR